jgi:hypothetical protein
MQWLHSHHRGHVVYKWTGDFSSASLPDETERNLRTRIQKILDRHGVPSGDVREIVRELIDEVSFAYAGHKHRLEKGGAGRPLNGPANLLSVNVADLLGKHGLRGNWLDPSWAGQMGPVAELEAVAQTALREACGETTGVMARPARTSKARKTLGKIDRE